MESTSDRLGSLLDELVGLAQAAGRDRAVELAGRLRAGDLRVALVGEAKRGKSTLGNALLGAEVLPTGVVPVTAISTEVRAGDPPRAEVSFTDGRRLCVGIRQVADYVSEKANPHNELRVATVRIHLPDALPHPRLVLVDSPGVGSVHTHNTDEARQAFASMDAAVLVLTADAPMSASELALLREVTAQAVRVFVVLNKADQLDASEVNEAEAFVSELVGEAVGAQPQVWVCSARDAVRARGCGDEGRWLASGVTAFTEALLDYLVRHRESALHSSIAGSAARLADTLLDGAVLALAAVEAVQASQGHKLVELARAVDRVTERRDEAMAVVRERLRVARAELDADAATQVTRTGDAVTSTLATALDVEPGTSAEELEARGREVIGEITRSAVERWRGAWQHRLDELAVTLVERSQSVLAEAAGDLYAEVLDVLGVRLHSEVPVVPALDLPAVRYDFGPEVGWNQPAAAWLRTHAPRALARRRTLALLAAEAPGLVDKHVGRARADIQQQLDRMTRRLTGIVSTCFADLTANLEAGQRLAEDTSKRSEQENEAAAARLRARRDALQMLSQQLRAAAAPGPGDADDRGNRDETTGAVLLRQEVR